MGGSHYLSLNVVDMIEEKIYDKNNVVSFAKIAGEWGYFSNMHNSALFVNETFIPSVEALYQSCKYPLFPNIQKEILSQNNAMKAKGISRKYYMFQRQDWEDVKFPIMRWCLMVKLIQNWDDLAPLLLKTKGCQIVEYSTKDAIWGAMPYGYDKLKGKNILGRLLMDIRDKYIITNTKPKFIPPLQISSFQLYGVNIGRVYPAEYYEEDF